MGKSMDSENIVQGEEKIIDTNRLHAKSKESKPIVIAIKKRLARINRKQQENKRIKEQKQQNQKNRNW